MEPFRDRVNGDTPEPELSANVLGSESLNETAKTKP